MNNSSNNKPVARKRAAKVAALVATHPPEANRGSTVAGVTQSKPAHGQLRLTHTLVTRLSRFKGFTLGHLAMDIRQSRSDRDAAALRNILSDALQDECDKPNPEFPLEELQMDWIEVGDQVLVFTVTHFYVGRIVLKSAAGMLLENAAWVANVGTHDEALLNGNLEVLSVVPPKISKVLTINGEKRKVSGCVAIKDDVIVSIYYWPHALPTHSTASSSS